jgi:hypothetical protein
LGWLMTDNCLYIFLDEGGNFDFTERGTKYFTLTCTLLKRPFDVCSALKNYKYDCIEYGLDIEHFHCCKDNKHIKNKVFGIIGDYLQDIEIYSFKVNKKLFPNIGSHNAEIFYSSMITKLLEVLAEELSIKRNIEKIVIITDQIPIAKKRKIIIKTIKENLPRKIKESNYQILHHSSKSHVALQIADYCNWALFRMFETGDETYFQKIRPSIKNLVELKPKAVKEEEMVA